jgi:hypothetical protein
MAVIAASADAIFSAATTMAVRVPGRPSDVRVRCPVRLRGGEDDIRKRRAVRVVEDERDAVPRGERGEARDLFVG